MDEDFSLNVVNRYQCQLSSGGVIDNSSLEGNVTAGNTSTTTSLKELTVFLAVPDKNITTEVKFEDLTPGSSLEKELMSIKLNPKDNPPPVIVTETISSGGKPDEDYRVLYPQRDNKILDKLTVKNQGSVLVPTIRLTKNMESISNFNQNQIKVDSGKCAIEKNALIWDIVDLQPGQYVTLTFTGDLVVGSMEPPLNGWISLIYEISPKKENNNMWNIKEIKGEILPKTSEQILYDLAISESPFELAKISASRAISMVEIDTPDTIRVLFESVLKNTGTVSLNDIEIIHQFPNFVELPSASEVSLTLRATQVSNSNFEVHQSPSEEVPDCILFRILIRNLTGSLGGLKGGEEIHVTFPLFLKSNLASGVLKYPTFFNALVKPNTPLLEDTTSGTSIVNVQLKHKSKMPAIKPAVAEKSFEAEVIRKFSTLAVDAYNARNYDDALAYCEQILAITQKIEDKTMTQNFIKIITKIKGIIQQNIQSKGKGASTSTGK